MTKPKGGIYVEFRALIDRLTSDFNKATNSVTKLERNFTSVFKNVERVIQSALVIGGVVAVKKLSDSLTELANKGEAAGSVAEGFYKLGGSAGAIEQAKNSTLKMVDAFSLMEIASSGLVKKVPLLNENFGQIAELGARLANTLNKDTKEAIQQVTDAIASGNRKKLEAIGIIINETEAYENYRKIIGKVEGELTKAQKKEAMQIESQKKLTEAIQRLAPVTDSVANANKAFNTSIDEGIKKTGIAVNNNQELTRTWRELATTVDDIDWENLGNSLANVAAIFATLAKNILPSVVSGINDFARGLDFLFGNSEQASADAIAGIINKINSELDEYEARVGRFTGKGGPLEAAAFEKNKQKVEELKKRLELEKKNFDYLYSKINSSSSATSNLTKETENNIKSIKDALNHASEDARKNTGLTQEQIRKLSDEWNKTLSNIKDNDLKTSIQEAIKTGNVADFSILKEQLKKNLIQAFVEAHKEQISSGVATQEEIYKAAEELANNQVESYENSMSEAIKNNADELRKEQEAAYKEGVETWRSLFENAFTGAAFNLEDALKKVAVGFAAQLAQSFIGMPLNIGSAQDLGGWLANQVFGKATQGVTGNLFDSIGLGSILGGGRPDGVSGPLMESGALGIGPQSAIIAQAALSLKGIEDLLSGKKTSGVQGWAARGSLAMSTFGISEVARAFGFGGGKSPQAQAEKDFSNFIEKAINEIKSFTLFNASGKATTMSGKGYNFYHSPDGKGTFDFSALDSNAQNVFDGLAEGIKRLANVTDVEGARMKEILASNLLGSIDNARLLVYQLGYSFEDLKGAIYEAATSGEIRWSEFNSQVAGLQEAFKPGLEALGDISGAWEEFIGAGGRGMAAIKGVRDQAIEGMEAQLVTVEELRDKLLAEGKDPGQVEAFYNALKQNGINTLQQLADAQDELIGKIVGSTESGSSSLQDEWEKMEQGLKGIKNILEEMPKEVDVKLNWHSEFDKNTSKILSGDVGSQTGLSQFARGGVITGRSLFAFDGGMGLAGEGGAEAIMPLARINGKLGVHAFGSGSGGNTTNITVHAPGAAPGVERDILKAIQEAEDRAVYRAARIRNESIRRANYLD